MGREEKEKETETETAGEGFFFAHSPEYNEVCGKIILCGPGPRHGPVVLKIDLLVLGA
jgi:hypothetical protein